MVENNEIRPMWPAGWFLAWIRDCVRGICLYLLFKMDNVDCVPSNTRPEDMESLPPDFEEIVEVENVDENSINEVPEVEPEEMICDNRELPESSSTNAQLQEMVEHNALLRQRESSLMQMLHNTTDGSFRLIMTPGTV